MTFRNILLSIISVLFISGCAVIDDSDSDHSSSTNTNTNTQSSSSSSGSNSTSSTSGSSTNTFAAHTLRDSNPPINVNSKGQVVSESTWNSFRNAADSKFYDNYNFTYETYSGGLQQFKYFTKDGYSEQSIYGKSYYERKSGDTFYQYISTNQGWLRQETTFDIRAQYVYTIKQHIYEHMFDFSNYEYDDYDGSYVYRTTAFGTTVMFQGGYLTYLQYSIGQSWFILKNSFETTIDIPASYC